MWIGVDIGGTKTAVVLSAEPPSVIARVEFPTQPADGPEPAIHAIKQAIAELLKTHAVERIEAIGVSCGGPLDRSTGMIQAPPNLWTWIDVPIVSILESEFGTRCFLENDANAGAVAEHRFGAGRGTGSMMFLTMGTGLGAGLILDGKLYHGASDSAGEVGHVRLTRTGPVGYNKAGSVEGWASGGGMAQVAEAMVKAAQKRGVQTCLSGKPTARDVGMAAQKGDAVARKIVRATGRRLGQTLAILIDILNPEAIVIGGLAMRLGADLLDPARAVVRREALTLAAAACRIKPAELGERIGDIAALSVALGLCAGT